MADKTYIQLYLYKVPSDWRDAVTMLLEEHGLRPSDDDPNEKWFDDEIAMGTLDDLAPKLGSFGVTFEGWEDPKYEHPGIYWCHVPGLGIGSGICDSQGELYLRAFDIHKAIKSTTTKDGLVAALRHLTLYSWHLVLEEYRGRQGEGAEVASIGGGPAPVAAP